MRGRGLVVTVLVVLVLALQPLPVPVGTKPLEKENTLLFVRLILDVLYVPQVYHPMHCSEMSQAKDLALL